MTAQELINFIENKFNGNDLSKVFIKVNNESIAIDDLEFYTKNLLGIEFGYISINLN